jgi:hypothetical protein
MCRTVMRKLSGGMIAGCSGTPLIEPGNRGDGKGNEATSEGTMLRHEIFVGRRWPGLLRLFG